MSVVLHGNGKYKHHDIFLIFIRQHFLFSIIEDPSAGGHFY